MKSQSEEDLSQPEATKIDYGGEYDENGVDVSLIRYMLSLSPLERVLRMEQRAKECWELYEYGRRHREAESAKTR
jgi:hypothetical protein